MAAVGPSDVYSNGFQHAFNSIEIPTLICCLARENSISFFSFSTLLGKLQQVGIEKSPHTGNGFAGFYISFTFEQENNRTITKFETIWRSDR